MDGPPEDQQVPPPPDAAKAETRLRGHLGHLTSKEEAAFTAFKELCASEGFYTPATPESKASHDDGTLMYELGPSYTRLLCCASLADHLAVDI